MESRIILLGGGKTAYNLYRRLEKENLHPEAYNFPGEYMNNKKIGTAMEASWKGFENLSVHDKAIVTSETVFNFLPVEDRITLEPHYFLRNKLNLETIAAQISVNSLKSIDILKDQWEYPLAVKPKESAAKKVDFKFKVAEDSKALEALKDQSDDCIFQRYLDPKSYRQIAIAGYFTGTANSLITVEQLNQYPIGVSSFIKKIDGQQVTKEAVANYLNQIGYKGFLELEFKQSKADGSLYLIDINPRTWGWSHFYIDAVQNLAAVLIHNADPVLKLKNGWINVPRLLMSNAQGRFVNPGLFGLISNKYSYEPYF